MNVFSLQSLQELMSRKCTMEEFDNLREHINAELFAGYIYIGKLDDDFPPSRIHQEISAELVWKIRSYIKRTKCGCKAYAAPFSVRLSENTTVQPDIAVVCDRSKLTESGCEGAPDMIIEISSSYAYNDYVYKHNIYKIYGVREYWVVNPYTKRLTVYKFDGGEPKEREYKFSDTITAGIFKDNPEPLQICVADLISDY